MDIENLKKNPEQVKQLIGLLSSLLDTNEDIPKQPNQSNDNKPRNKYKKIDKKTHPRPLWQQLFLQRFSNSAATRKHLSLIHI